MTTTPKQIVYCYSKEDQELQTQLARALAPLRRDGLLVDRGVHDLTPGDDLAAQYQKLLLGAERIVVLLSTSLFADDKEPAVQLSQALAQRGRVVAIYLRPAVGWESTLQGIPVLGQRLAVTQWDNRDAAWAEMVAGLCAVLGLTPPPPVVTSDQTMPRYVNDATRAQSERLQRLLGDRDRARSRGEDPRPILQAIRALKSEMRTGPQLQPGEVLGGGSEHTATRYLLLQRLGAGGSAEVWRATDQQEQRTVAVRVLKETQHRERFERGARCQAGLVHPHIARLLSPGVVEDRGFFYFIMEYLAGGDLSTRVGALRVSADRALQILLRVGDALVYAHSHGIIHRDVKPANVLLAAAEGAEPKLIDFDLYWGHNTSGFTKASALGTLGFTAPEVLFNARDNASEQADVYSLGMTAIFLLSGENLSLRAYHDLGSVIEALSCSEGIKDALAQATAWERAERFRTMKEFCDALSGKGRARPRPRPPGPLVGYGWVLFAFLFVAAGLFCADYFRERYFQDRDRADEGLEGLGSRVVTPRKAPPRAQPKGNGPGR